MRLWPRRPFWLLVLAVAALAALLPSCRCGTVNDDSKSALPPLDAPEIASLDAVGYLPGVLAVPRLATEARPILIALHGAADLPEWQCNTWKSVSRGRGFVLCPRGVPNPGVEQRFDFAAPAATSGEVRSALTQLKKNYGRYVAAGPVILAGFDRGAEHALSIARQEPAFFARLALISGSAIDWSSSLSAVYAHGGGQRVLFLCTSRACADSAERAQSFLRPYAVEVHHVFLGEWGPVFDGRVAAALETQWPWLSEALLPWES